MHWKLLVLLTVVQSYQKGYYFIRFGYQTYNLIYTAFYVMVSQLAQTLLVY